MARPALDVPADTTTWIAGARWLAGAPGIPVAAASCQAKWSGKRHEFGVYPENQHVFLE
jgi:hypothetical protein